MLKPPSDLSFYQEAGEAEAAQPEPQARMPEGG